MLLFYSKEREKEKQRKQVANLVAVWYDKALSLDDPVNGYGGTPDNYWPEAAFD